MINIVFTILIERTRKSSQAAQLRYVCVSGFFLSNIPFINKFLCFGSDKHPDKLYSHFSYYFSAALDSVGKKDMHRWRAPDPLHNQCTRKDWIRIYYECCTASTAQTTHVGGGHRWICPETGTHQKLWMQPDHTGESHVTGRSKIHAAGYHIEECLLWRKRGLFSCTFCQLRLRLTKSDWRIRP